MVQPLANSALASPLREGVLILLAAASWRFTPKAHRDSNAFDWAPAVEVAKLFAGIFVTIIPAVIILRAGTAGAFAPLFALLGTPDAPHDRAYFWLTGALSAFLDNAPTYLVFFSATGGDAAGLMASHSGTLAAISAGAVFMGALTYVGNAPNLLVRAIAHGQGVRMPGFLGYMLWAAIFLLPCLLIVSFVFFDGG
jgi:Na+/H+ antiporter NhaD/arsenite permease-like protein